MVLEGFGVKNSLKDGFGRFWGSWQKKNLRSYRERTLENTSKNHLFAICIYVQNRLFDAVTNVKITYKNKKNARSYRGATPETGVPRLAIRTLPQKSV